MTNPPSRMRCIHAPAFIIVIVTFLAANLQAGTNILFSTGFEQSEGYNPIYTLEGQNGWVANSDAGNGLITDPLTFPGLGQQAYIGYFPPTDLNTTFLIWKPINFAPVPTNAVVTFSVLMAIIDSTNHFYDDFRWSVYNTNGSRLFSLNFDNTNSLAISYWLDGTNSLVSTGKKFTNDVQYALKITMNFPSNRWSATLNGVPLTTNLPLTTVNAALNLGDIDAAWEIRGTQAGNNFMEFDNYRIEVVTPPVAQLLSLGRTNGQFQLKLFSQANLKYAIEASTNLSQWLPLRTNTTASDGTFTFIDASIPNPLRRFYRARLVP